MASPTFRHMNPPGFDPLAALISAACVPLDQGHASGTLELAEKLLCGRPGIATASIHAAAILGDDAATVRSLTEREPQLVYGLLVEAGRFLALFAGNGNTGGVRHLLDLGVDVQACFAEGDGYFGVAKNSTALHVAAWRARHATVRLLIERGAQVNERDGAGRTPLALAVRACVDSYWTERRSPESVDALLRAGAAVSGVPFPSGYADIDALLQSHGATA